MKKKAVSVVVLHTNGAFEEKRLAVTEFDTELGGYLEALPTKKPTQTAYVNEDGLSKGLARNAWTDFLRQESYLCPRQVVGKVILCSLSRNGNDTDVSKAVLLAVNRYYESNFARKLDENKPDASSVASVDEKEDVEPTQDVIQRLIAASRANPTEPILFGGSTCFGAY